MSLFLIIAASCLAAASGGWALALRRRPALAQRFATATLGLGALLGLAGAVLALSGQEAAWSAPWPTLRASLSLKVDALSAFFLLPVLGLPALASVYGLGYWPQAAHGARSIRLQLYFGLVTGAMTLVCVAANAVLFLVAWEVMALAGFLLVFTEHEKPEVQRAAFVYLASAHAGNLALFALFALLGRLAGSFEFAAMAGLDGGGPLAGWIFGLALFGFGLKAGLVPFHFWLPGAHAAAPGHVSAILSGVLLKTGHLRAAADHRLLRGGAGGLGRRGPGGGRGLGHPRRGLRAGPARREAAAGLPLGGEPRHHRHGDRPGAAGPGQREPGAGGARLLRRGPPRRQPRPLQGAALPRARAPSTTPPAPASSTSSAAWRAPCPSPAALFLVGAAAISGLPPLNGFVSEWLVFLAAFQAVARPRARRSAAGRPGGAGAGAGRRAGRRLLRQGLRHRLPGPRPLAPTPRAATRPPRAMLARWRRWRPPALAIGLFPAAWLPGLARAAAGWSRLPLAALARPAEEAGRWRPGSVSLVAGLLLLLVACWWPGAAAGSGAPSRRRRPGAAATPRRPPACSTPAPPSPSSWCSASAGSSSRAPRSSPPAGLFPRRASFDSHVPDTVLELAILPALGSGVRGADRLRAQFGGRVQSKVLLLLLGVLGLLAWLALG